MPGSVRSQVECGRIIRDLRVSDDDAFYEEYLAPLERRMLRIVWRIVRDPEAARDVLQDALVRLWRERDRVRAHPNPEALVLRICIGASVDAARRARRRLAVEAEVPVGAATDPERSSAAAVELREIRALVLEAIARLPERQAAAVMMRIVEEKSYAAIALALGCSEPSARVHVMRGRAKLARWLARLAPAPRRGGGEA